MGAGDPEGKGEERRMGRKLGRKMERGQVIRYCHRHCRLENRRLRAGGLCLYSLRRQKPSTGWVSMPPSPEALLSSPPHKLFSDC